jgi:hypothetical protein
MPGSNSETSGRFSHGLSSDIVVEYTRTLCPNITLHGRITTREYVGKFGNQVHPMIQTLFPNKDAVFQDDSASFTQSCFEGHEVEHHLPWPTQSPDLSINKALVSFGD